jgi:hypothetical protein
MGETDEQGCPNCARLEERVAALEALIEESVARVSDLEAELAKHKRNSSNSSKPPSRRYHQAAEVAAGMLRMWLWAG